MFDRIQVFKNILGICAGYALLVLGLCLAAKPVCAADQSANNKTLMFYKVGQQENLGQLLFRLRLFPLWGAKSTVKQICELNKKTVSNDCNIVQANSKLYFPLEMLAGKYLNYQVDRQTTQIFIHEKPETTTSGRSLARTIASIPSPPLSLPATLPSPPQPPQPAPHLESAPLPKQMTSSPQQAAKIQETIVSKPSLPLAVANEQHPETSQPVLFDLGAASYFSEYNSTDASNNVSSHFASKLNFGLDMGLSYVWNNQFRNRFYFSQQRLGFENVAYPIANLSALGLQNTYYSSFGITMSASGGIRQIIILRNGSLDKKVIPHLGTEVALTLLKVDMVAADLALGAEYLFGQSPSSSYSIKGGYAYDIKIRLKKEKKYKHLATEFFYRSENQNSSISQQNSNSLGIRISYNFGEVF